MSAAEPDIVLNRAAGVSIRDQLVTQLELRILSGSLAASQRLPSVRALARRLGVHPNTVSAAYRDLEAAGHVELRTGSGVYVKAGGPVTIEHARGIDEMIRIALYAAFAKGYGGQQIRAAVERWLAAAPPERILAVDPSLEMAQLLARELALTLGGRVESCGLEAAAAEPQRLAGSLAVCLPYHVDALRGISPTAAVEPLTLEFSRHDRDIVAALPEGSVVLVVTSSPTVVPFAQALLGSLRGDEILVQVRTLDPPAPWRRLAPSADLVLADVVSVEVVRRARPRKLQEFRLVASEAAARLRDALSVVVPAAPDPAG